MDPKSTQARIQICPRCVARLDVTGSVTGAWLSCPGCGQPMQVKRPPLVRTSVADAVSEPPSTSWADDPRLEASSKSADIEAGPRRSEQRAGILQILLLSSMAGLGNAMFAGTFLMVVNPKELGLCWAFGTLLALFVAVMVNTMRWGGTEERRDRS